jgi:hypothetical protein
MDNFYLVLIKKDGNIIHNSFATTHRDLIDKYVVPQNISNNDWFRATFCPKEGHKLIDLENYQLLINEIFVPDWFNETFKLNTVTKLQEIIRSMFISTHRTLVLNEGVILTKTAKIDEVKNSIVFGMYDTSNIKFLDSNSEVLEMADETLIEQTLDNTKVTDMFGYSKIIEMHGSSKVVKMFGQAKVLKMFDNSRISTLRGDAVINEMRDESGAERLRHFSKVEEMHGNSIIEQMWDWTTVGAMYDNAQINYMDDESKVLEMHGNSIVHEMYGSSVIGQLCENSLVRRISEMASILKKQLE